MSLVPSVNVFMSRSKEALDEVISGGDLSLDITGPNAVYSSKNMNFLEVRHNLMTSNDFTLTLKINDPNRTLFESLTIPNDVNEFLEDIQTDESAKKYDFFVTYGIGENFTNHWAGPFQCSIFNYHIYSEYNGGEVVEIDFVPNLPMEAHLTTGASRFNKQIFSATTRSSKPALSRVERYLPRENPGSISYLGQTDVRVSLEKMEVPRKFPHISIIKSNDDDIVNAVQKVFRRYGKSWGIENFYFMMPKEFKKVISSGLSNKSVFKNPITLSYRSHRRSFNPIKVSIDSLITAVINNARSVTALSEVLGPFGLTAYFEPSDPKSNSGDVFIDLAKFVKKGQFIKFSKTFFEELSQRVGTTLIPHMIIENNKKIVKFCKDFGELEEGVCDNEDKPLVIVGEETALKKEYFQLGNITACTVTGNKLSEKARGFIRDYYINKHTPHPKNYYEDYSNSFDLQQEDSETKKEDVVAFKAGVKNSNILSYSFDASLFSLAAVKRKINLPEDKKGEVSEFIKKQLDRHIKDPDKYDISDITNKLVDILYNTEEGMQIPVTEAHDSSWKAALSTYMRGFIRSTLFRGITGTIKTIPYFQYSDVRLLGGQECTVEIERNPSLDRYPVLDDSDTFYSGDYMITGFTHVITSTDAYSEFAIIKKGASKKGEE